MSSIFQSTCTFFSIYFFVFLFQFVIFNVAPLLIHRRHHLTEASLHLLIVNPKTFSSSKKNNEISNFSRSPSCSIPIPSQNYNLRHHSSLCAEFFFCKLLFTLFNLQNTAHSLLLFFSSLDDVMQNCKNCFLTFFFANICGNHTLHSKVTLLQNWKGSNFNILLSCLIHTIICLN